MKYKTYLFIFLLSLTVIYMYNSREINSQTVNKNNNLYAEIKSISQKNTITISDIKYTYNLVNKFLISDEKKRILPDEVVIIFSNICIKNGTKSAISIFIDFLIEHKDSAMEELSFSFERIFEKYQIVTLSLIKEQQYENRNKLLNHIFWGFINNKSAKVKRYKPTSENYYIIYQQKYKEIFFDSYPELKNIKKYQSEIEYILNKIENYFIHINKNNK